MNFGGDLRAIAIGILSEEAWIGEKAAVTTLQDEKTSDLLILLLNWLSRLVHPHPRKVLFSKDVQKNELFCKFEPQIRSIVQKIMNGDDINAHLSERVKVKFATQAKRTKKLHRRKDLDGLLNDWGIHHLHISNQMACNNFVKRDKFLLFVLFTMDAAYILNIGEHHFSDTDLVKNAVRNWPEEALFYELKGITSDELTDEQRLTCRKKGINTIIAIDGKAFISRTAGITCAGTSSQNTMEAIRIQGLLKELEKKMNEGPQYYKNFFDQNKVNWPTEPEFKLVFANSPTGYQLGLQEEKTGFAFGIYPLPPY